MGGKLGMQCNRIREGSWKLFPEKGGQCVERQKLQGGWLGTVVLKRRLLDGRIFKKLDNFQYKK